MEDIASRKNINQSYRPSPILQLASPKCVQTNATSVTYHLSPGSALLGHLALLSLLLLLQELALLVGAHLAEFAVALLLLELLGLHTALLRRLFVVKLAQLASLVFTGDADLAQGFGAEVGGADEVVGHAEESGEEGGRGWLGVEAHGKVHALTGNEVVKSGSLMLAMF